MAVVEIVDEADVRHAIAPQPLENGDLVLGFAEPAAMVVDANLGSDLIGFRRYIAHSGSRLAELIFLR